MVWKLLTPHKKSLILDSQMSLLSHLTMLLPQIQLLCDPRPLI